MDLADTDKDVSDCLHDWQVRFQRKEPLSQKKSTYGVECGKHDDMRHKRHTYLEHAQAFKVCCRILLLLAMLAASSLGFGRQFCYSS